MSKISKDINLVKDVLFSQESSNVDKEKKVTEYMDKISRIFKVPKSQLKLYGSIHRGNYYNYIAATFECYHPDLSVYFNVEENFDERRTTCTMEATKEDYFPQKAHIRTINWKQPKVTYDKLSQVFKEEVESITENTEGKLKFSFHGTRDFEISDLNEISKISKELDELYKKK